MQSEQQRIGLRSFLLPLSINESPGSFACLFTQNQVVEILEPRFVPQIPGSPGYLVGVLLYHGILLPVIDLDALCNRRRSARRKSYRQLVVIRTGMVDPEGTPLKAVVAVMDRVRIAKISGKDLAEAIGQQEAPPLLRKSGLLRGCFRHDDDTVVLLDLGPVARGKYAAT